MRIDLVGTTADFRRFGHPQTLPINHLLCENRRTQGRMGEVGLTERLAHQFISGSSMTACHNPACTVQTIEETGSYFLPARETPIVSSNSPSPRSRTRLARKP